MQEPNARLRLRVSFAAMFLVALPIFLAGCGGGGDDGGTSSATPATTASPTPTSSNGAPTLTGKPRSAVLAGQTYSFQPSASDPNDDKLTFTAANLPGWASFNANTGKLSGKPGSADVGNYSGITITVSDGSNSASIGPFAIAVSVTASGSATVSWTPPTQNSDGSSLTNLAGYRIMYGPSVDELDQSIGVENPSVSTFVVENLTSGTWYFAVVAINSAGTSSDLSNIGSKTIG